METFIVLKIATPQRWVANKSFSWHGSLHTRHEAMCHMILTNRLFFYSKSSPQR